MNVKKVSLFIFITYFITWLLLFMFHFLGGKWNTPAATIAATFSMFVPMIAALIVQKGIYRQEIKGPLGLSFKINKFWLIAWFLPLFVSLGTLAASLLMPDVEFTPDLSGVWDKYKDILPPEQIEEARLKIANLSYSPIWVVVGQTALGFFAGISVNGFAAFGEELGWRGFLVNEFKGLNFWTSSMITGFIWGLWHFPMILMGHNYPQHPQIGVLFMIIFCMLLSPIMTHLRIKSKSVIAAAIFHGTINGTAGLPIMLSKGGDDLTVGITGLAGIIVLAAVNVCVYFIRRRERKQLL